MPRLVTVLVLALTATAAAAAPGYYRHPAIHGDTVVFTAEGDLWTVPVSGGSARRLTTHPGEESRAAISPDGRQVAFTASYEGSPEVHVMPLAGGAPRRLSFENTRALVLGWTTDGEVLYSAPDGGRTWSMAVRAVRPDGAGRRTLPLADIGEAAIDPTGRWLYAVRFGLSLTNDNARRYRGGALSQLWRFDLAGAGIEARRIGPTDANLRRPMPWRDRLLVIADGDGRDNLWSLAADGSDARQLTRHRDFPVRTASLHGDRVVYQHGADLRVLDLADGGDNVMAITLASDFEQRRERWIDDPLRYLEQSSLAPAGDQVAVTARGRVVLAAVGPRRRVDIAAGDGVRLRAAVIAPDGKHVYAIGDGTGEEEVWRYPADGSGPGAALTDGGGIRRWGIHVSPDGRHLAHDDKRGRLWLLDLDSGRNRLIDDGGPDGNEGYAAVAWAADSRHLAFVRATSANGRNRIALYALDDGSSHWLTSDKYDSGSPAFGPDGRWLWFLSQREFRVANGSPWGDRNTGPFLDRRTRIYALALQDDQRFPFQPDDELAGSSADTKAQDDKDDEGRDAPVPAIVLEGLAQRLYEVPAPAGNYRQLRTIKERLYLLDRNGGASALKYLPIDNKQAGFTTVIADAADYDLSADGKKLHIRTPAKDDGQPGELYIADTATQLPDDLAKVTLKLDDWSLRIDPVAEWRQQFADAWRMHRDHFFDSALRGVDWTATRERHQPLLARVSDRQELDDLFAQMMAELGTLHSQVVGGDSRRADDGADPAFLGGRFEPVEGGWRVAHIHRSEAELPGARAPLQAPGVDVRIGDVITSVNGRPAAGVRDLSDLLRNQAGKQVLLELRRTGGGAFRVVVTAVDVRTEAQLRYGDWVQGSRDRVERAGDGRIGYLHLYAMGANDMAAFVREFYAQYEREGLIIDVRRNRGGNIDSWIIEKLLRRAWSFWSRPDGLPYTNMQQTFRGHLVVLTDALTYSDGETFAAGVKTLGLGPLIGTRTAGAGVWLSDGNRLADGGRVRVAEFPQFGLDGQWLVEGVGVEPDIEVDNPLHASFLGADAQLEAGIDWLQRKLASDPIPALRPLPPPPLTD